MNRIKQLRDERDTLVRALRQLMDETDRSEGRSGRAFTADDRKVYDEKHARIRDIDVELDALNSIEALESAQESNPPRITADDAAARAADRTDSPLMANFDRFLRRGWADFSTEEIHNIRADMARVANALSIGTDSQGGYTVATEVASRLLEAMKDFGGVQEEAFVLPTSSGNPFTWPTTDGTAEEGEIVAENASATELDPSFGQVAIGAYKYSSKVVTIPFELIQDSVIDIEAMVIERLAMRLARIYNKHFTIGTGTGQPQGVVTAAAAGKVGTTGQATSVIYNDFVDLMHSIDPAYRGSAKWMMHDLTLAKLYKLVDADGRPLFWAASRDLSDALPMTLLGRSIRINQNMPTMAANAKSILFGDFKKYMVRLVMAMTLFRFDDSAYIKKGQIGFLAWSRADGKYIDAGQAIKYYQNSAT